jgi:hypothetical protein
MNSDQFKNFTWNTKYKVAQRRILENVIDEIGAYE